jgi:hypothetical protein
MAGYFDNKNSLMSDIELMPHRIIRTLCDVAFGSFFIYILTLMKAKGEVRRWAGNLTRNKGATTKKNSTSDCVDNAAWCLQF